MFDAPLKVSNLMREFEPDWFIAGGWAIDLYLGKETRPHADIEIAIFRQDQIALQTYLQDWTLKIAENGELFDWTRGDFLELPIHAIHCFKDKNELSFLEILLNERDENCWQYRRNQQIVKSLPQISLMNDAKIRFLCPEIVLLYKSKNPRKKDERDFQIVVEHLEPTSKKWLKDAVSLCDPEHHWLSQLQN